MKISILSYFAVLKHFSSKGRYWVTGGGLCGDGERRGGSSECGGGANLPYAGEPNCSQLVEMMRRRHNVSIWRVHTHFSPSVFLYPTFEAYSTANVPCYAHFMPGGCEQQTRTHPHISFLKCWASSHSGIGRKGRYLFPAQTRHWLSFVLAMRMYCYFINTTNYGWDDLQADYHQQKFAPFSHVDSPARLIRTMQSQNSKP